MQQYQGLGDCFNSLQVVQVPTVYRVLSQHLKVSIPYRQSRYLNGVNISCHSHCFNSLQVVQVQKQGRQRIYRYLVSIPYRQSRYDSAVNRITDAIAKFQFLIGSLGTLRPEIPDNEAMRVSIPYRQSRYILPYTWNISRIGSFNSLQVVQVQNILNALTVEVVCFNSLQVVQVR